MVSASDLSLSAELPMAWKEGTMRPRRPKPDRGNSVSNLVTPTTAERLADGTTLDFVRVNGESRLLVWRNNRSRVAARYEVGRVVFEPMSLDPTVLEAVRFPGGTA